MGAPQEFVFTTGLPRFGGDAKRPFLAALRVSGIARSPSPPGREAATQSARVGWVQNNDANAPGGP